jgi:protein-disulfide isomerase
MLIHKIFLGLSAAALLAFGTLAGAPAAMAQENPPVFDATESEAIEAVVKQYLLDHPEILVEALHLYEQRQQAAEAERQKAALTAEAEALNHDPAAPVIGNPEGDVTLVEFFDYRCPYCKRMTDTLAQLVEEDPNLRLDMKEYPILSEESLIAARAALAADRQGKYESFHFALMEGGGGCTEGEIMAVAESVGLDLAKLRADMQDPEIEAALRRNHVLAERVGVSGTPAFIVDDMLLPGATSLEQLRAMIAEARAKAS